MAKACHIQGGATTGHDGELVVRLMGEKKLIKRRVVVEIYYYSGGGDV
jgi:hypothetical protein